MCEACQGRMASPEVSVGVLRQQVGYEPAWDWGSFGWGLLGGFLLTVAGLGVAAYFILPEVAPELAACFAAGRLQKLLGLG